MSSLHKVELRLDWCTHEAATWAVEHWHYSKRMPKSKLVKIGAWEDGVFIGCVLFGNGATPHWARKYGLKASEGCELVRIAMNQHQSPISRIGSIAIRLLKREYPRLRLIVSFSDPGQSHHGGIYQAMGWLYTGVSPGGTGYFFRDREWHPRAFGSTITPMHDGKVSNFEYAKYLDPQVRKFEMTKKYRYLLPLDDEVREKIIPLVLSYPKRPAGDTKDTPVTPDGKGRLNDDRRAPIIKKAKRGARA